MKNLTFHEYPKESENNNNITKKYSGEYKAIIGKGSNKEIVTIHPLRTTGAYTATRFHTLFKGSRTHKSDNLDEVINLVIDDGENFIDAHAA